MACLWARSSGVPRMAAKARVRQMADASVSSTVATIVPCSGAYRIATRNSSRLTSTPWQLLNMK